MAGKKILLVEDDNNLREIYGARLQAEGYDIVSAPDGENALAIAVKEKPDLIISDIMMPKVSGFDMLDILRNAPETKDTKIIMMTALSQAEDKARADKLGADMYLVKSQVTLEDVTKAVHKILDEPSDAAQEADSAAAQEMVSGPQQEDQKPKEHAAEEPQVSPAPQPQPQAQPQPEPQQSEPPKPEEPPQAEAPTPEPPSPPADNTTTSVAVKTEETVESPEAEVKPEPPAAENPQNAPASDAVADSAQAANDTPVSNSPADSDQANSEPVGPTLAQALEDEEKGLQVKVKDFDKTDDQPAQPETPVDDSSQTVEKDEQPSSDIDSTESPDNPLDDKPGKKVIKPINDLSKSPDINELIAKEEAKEVVDTTGTSQTNEIVKPQPAADDNSNGQSASDTKDDFGKISL